MSDLRTRFTVWKVQNPHVVEMFFRFADEAWESGVRPIGAKLITERLRWETVMASKGDPFKINNNFTAYLAREYVKAKPDRISLFEFREVQGGGGIPKVEKEVDIFDLLLDD